MILTELKLSEAESVTSLSFLKTWVLRLGPHGQNATKTQLAKQNVVCRVPVPAPQSINGWAWKEEQQINNEYRNA